MSDKTSYTNNPTLFSRDKRSFATLLDADIKKNKSEFSRDNIVHFQN